MSRLLPYAVFIALMFAVGFTAAAFSMPGEWYASIAKPWFNPPNWVFGPVWTLLYVLIGIAGAIAWRCAAGNVLTLVWAVQLLLNGAWSIVFFRLQNPEGALAVVLALLASILAFIAIAARPAPLAALLFVPYALWVSFASILNFAIVRLN
jgi:benzodiazapine receptor